MDKPKYIGSDKVVKVEKVDFTTSLGSKCVKYTIKREVENQGKTREYEVSNTVTDKLYSLIATDVPSTPNDLRDRQVNALITAVLQVMIEYGIKSKDIPYFLTQLGHSVQDSYERSAHIKWFGDANNWFPGMSFMDDISLLEADIEIQNARKDSDNA